MKRPENASADNTGRPYSRTRQSLVSRAKADATGELSAQSLSRLAGQVSVEALEPRQLLFSLTITPDLIDPTTGVGQIAAFFGYTIPYLESQDQNPQSMTETIEENFDDEDGAGGAGLGTINGNGERMLGSGLYITHTVAQPAANFAIAEPLMDDFEIRARLQAGESFSFQFADPGSTQLVFRSVSSMTFAYGAGFTAGGGQFPVVDGNNNPISTITYLFDGEIIETVDAVDVMNPAGIGQTTFQTTSGENFDQIIFAVTGGIANPTFFIDDVSFVLPARPFEGTVEARINGAELRFAGPVGATVQLLDLYGRDMVQTIRLGKPNNSDTLLVDRNFNGIPDFNDGIGRINFQNTDGRTSFTMVGGTIESFQGQIDPDADFVQAGFQFLRIEGFEDYYDGWEDTAGFGFWFDQAMPRNVVGLPSGAGSVVIGSPFVRDNTSTLTYNPLGPAINSLFAHQYTRSDQGFFGPSNSSMGSVTVHGMVFGSSRIDGSMNRFNVGVMYGSLTVEGDLGAYVVSSDAGVWVADDPLQGAGVERIKTSSQLVVGRTLGQMHVGGRSLVDVTVVGDISSPSASIPRDVFRYFELEAPYGIVTTADEEQVVQAMLNSTISDAVDVIIGAAAFPAVRSAQQALFGADVFRNDSLLSAEWVGSVASGVQIHGELFFADPINGNDETDVFAFASDGVSPLVVQLQSGLPANVHARILDQSGRTVASADVSHLVGNQLRIDYIPDGPGVYYLALGSVAASDAYVVTITGLAPTTFGMYRTGLSSGAYDTQGGGTNAITVLSGGIGAIRVGTGHTDADGDEVLADIVNVRADDDEQDDDDRILFYSGTISTPGNLYQILAGGDIGIPTNGAIASIALHDIIINVGGNLGQILTGQNNVVGQSAEQGDVYYASFIVGGSIGTIDIRGAIGIDQDTDPDAVVAEPGNVRIEAGANNDPSSIGLIRVGAHIGSDALQVITSDGSTIGAVLVSQDIDFGANDPNIGFYSFNALANVGPSFQLGAGSDIKFISFPAVDLPNAQNAFIPIIGGSTVNLTDDSGASVQISAPGAVNGAQVGLIRVMPVDSSLGVAIGDIVIDLTGSVDLNITATGPLGQLGTVGIGRIQILGASADSNITISGSSEIDVWQIESQAPLFNITNTSVDGDIVTMDVTGVNGVAVSGSLGRTQLPEWGPRRIGPALTLEDVALTAAFISANWNGDIFRPANDGDYVDTNAYLDDLGSPIDFNLDGLLVRSGSVQFVRADGSIGDVIVTAGDIVEATANFDGDNDLRFDGIVGTLFANDVITVDVGDGLAARAQSPFATTGIFARDDVHTITAQNGASIRSIIGAFNNVVFDREVIRDGIDTISVIGGGDYVDAYIFASFLDAFWNAFEVAEVFGVNGNINTIEGTDANFFRSRVLGANLNTFQLTNGAFDASFVNATGNINTFEAAEYRNTTRLGTVREFRESAIVVGGDVDSLRTLPVGSMADTRIDILGSITGGLNTKTMTRVKLDVDNQIELLSVTDSIRASNITAGAIENFMVTEAIRTSSINVSGPLVTLMAKEITGSSIEVSGVDGRIGTLTTTGILEADIASSGPIGTIESLTSDIVASITTTTDRGNITVLRAARDLDIVTDVSGNIGLMVAGRNIGNRDTKGIILVRGNLQQADASGGQLHADLRIGNDITGSVDIGTVSNKPGDALLGGGSIVAFGRINAVNIGGDYAAEISSFSGGIGSITITEGSFLQSARVNVLDGSLGVLRIINGHLLGDVYADNDITLIDVQDTGSGVFGDIGINPTLSAGQGATSTRNELPPGTIPSTAIDGPSILAGHNIGQVLVGGSIFETLIHAGRSVGFVGVTHNIRNDDLTSGIGTVIAAGDLVRSVSIGANAQNLLVLAGVVSFGADGVAGGTGDNADVIKAGRVQSVDIGFNANNVRVGAGIVAGADGQYNTADDRHALGLSYVTSVDVAGTATNVSAHADSGLTSVSSGVVLGGRATPVVDGVLEPVLGGFGALGTELTNGIEMVVSTTSSEQASLLFTGPGRAFWDAANNRVVLFNSRPTSSLVVTSLTVTTSPLEKTLTDFSIVTNDDAMLGTLTVNANLTGNSNIAVDGYLRSITVQDWTSTGSILVGNDVQTATFGSFTKGRMQAIRIGTLAVTGDLGGTFDFFGSSGVGIGGNFSGVISMDRALAGALTIGGAVNRGAFRTAQSVGSITAASLNEARFSALDDIGAVTIAGNVRDSSIMAGADLGRNAVFGGTGLNADRVTSGSIGAVMIGGNFLESDIISGRLRGTDGFFGTSDDLIADGRGDITGVTIAGTQVGSSLGSESYRISATGTIGAVTIGGQNITQTGNFAVETPETQPEPIRIESISVVEASRIYSVEVVFNQAMNVDTIGQALSLSQVRDNDGQVLLRLAEGLDYSIEYDADSFTASILVNQAITSQGLPITPGVAHAGIYRVEFDDAVLRASLVGARLDGDHDGFAEVNDDFSTDIVIGDAGDKLSAQQIALFNEQNQFVKNADIYAPVNLDVVLDNNATPDGVPDVNTTFRIQGSIGDHPDNDTNLFGFSGDVDVYQLTLQAGQILRLDEVSGAASNAVRFLYNSNNQSVGAVGSDALLLPGPFDPVRLVTTEFNYLINETGTYTLVVSSTFGTNSAFSVNGTVPNVQPVAQAIGNYAFNITIFDDGDTGFSSDTNSGDGRLLPEPPAPIAFAGVDGLFGTSDDVAAINFNGFNFTLDAGADATPNTADDLVSGSLNNATITRTGAGVVTSNVVSAIGSGKLRGVPGQIAPDVDVFHINARNEIEAGTEVRVTVKLSELGADIGSRLSVLDPNFSGQVQLAIFETTNSTSIDDGVLVVSPTDFAPSGSTPGTIADDGVTSYGYDENGDFFMVFRTPGSLASADPANPDPASYAVYLQGVYNADYEIEIVVGQDKALVRKSQNFFLELNGGTVDWLLSGEQLAEFDAFDTRVLGFTGKINNVPVNTYIATNLVTRLEAIFAARGYDVDVSTNSANFEFEDFSTVFITNTNDPITFFNDGIYGFSQRSDPFNADRNDEAVVFVPSFTTLGYTPSQTDIDGFTDSLTGAVARRMGELLGLRISANTGSGATVDPMAANSVATIPATNGGYRFSAIDRALSPTGDSLDSTDFYLGRINGASLLDAILSPE